MLKKVLCAEMFAVNLLFVTLMHCCTLNTVTQKHYTVVIYCMLVFYSCTNEKVFKNLLHVCWICLFIASSISACSTSEFKITV